MNDTSHYAECLTLLNKYKRLHLKRLVILAILMIMNFYVHVCTVDDRTGVSHLAFGTGTLTLLLSLACLLLALFGDHQHPKLYFILIALLVVGGVTNCYQWLIATLMALLYLIALPEYRKMNWILKQPGYPYFNERFQEQLLHSEYEPMHKLDNKNHGVMAGLENGEEAVISKVVPSSTNVSTATYILDTNSAPDEMPGISDVFEQPVPLSEPELPNVNDIPVPSWTVPDTNPELNFTKSDIFIDTSAVLSDFPEIAGDIPDLPELPDIPQI